MIGLDVGDYAIIAPGHTDYDDVLAVNDLVVVDSFVTGLERWWCVVARADDRNRKAVAKLTHLVEPVWFEPGDTALVDMGDDYLMLCDIVDTDVKRGSVRVKPLNSGAGGVWTLWRHVQLIDEWTEGDGVGSEFTAADYHALSDWLPVDDGHR